MKLQKHLGGEEYGRKIDKNLQYFPTTNFSSKSSVELMGDDERRIICLGSSVMENSNYKSIKKKWIKLRRIDAIFVE